MKSEIAAVGQVKQASMEGKILRCRCGNPHSHIPNPCPQGIWEPVGTLAFTHSDWRVRLAHRILTWSGYGFQLWVYGRRAGRV